MRGSGLCGKLYLFMMPTEAMFKPYTQSSSLPQPQLFRPSPNAQWGSGRASRIEKSMRRRLYLPGHKLFALYGFSNHPTVDNRDTFKILNAVNAAHIKTLLIPKAVVEGHVFIGVDDSRLEEFVLEQSQSLRRVFGTTVQSSQQHPGTHGFGHRLASAVWNLTRSAQG